MKPERAHDYKCDSEVFKAIAIASVASHNHRYSVMQMGSRVVRIVAKIITVPYYTSG